MKKIVVALGGNALQESGQPATAESQLKIIKRTTNYLADFIEEGYQVVIAHGNGPQVGRILLQNEIAVDTTPTMPFDVCGSMSQGMIGYYVQQTLGEHLKNRGIYKPVVTLVTQVVVDENDQAFNNPTKPIGPFYSEEEAKMLEKTRNFVMKEDSGRGYRRVVASPIPKKIVEINSIKTLVENDNVVISVGGGGIPVIETANNSLKGVPAVIDKDFASEKLAEELNADIFLILTAVEQVAVNFGKPNQKNLDKITVLEANQYIKEGQFAPGSMLPKIQAALNFVEYNSGIAIIASLDKAKEALKGKSGTRIQAS